jgi:hypothetical protein
LGAYLVDRAVRNDSLQTPGQLMARLIDETSGRINPWRLDASARDAVGARFTNLYAAWRDSVGLAEDCRARATCIAADVQARGAWNAASPRFGADGTLRVVMDDVRRMPGLYALESDGSVRRVARRNSVDANAPLDATRTVYAEWDLTDPYSVRSDLYLGTGPARRRLSMDERIAAPDVHVGSGRIVAVQTEPGTTDLVLFDDVDAGRLRAGRWTAIGASRDGRAMARALRPRGGTVAGAPASSCSIPQDGNGSGSLLARQTAPIASRSWARPSGSLATRSSCSRATTRGCRGSIAATCGPVRTGWRGTRRPRCAPPMFLPMARASRHSNSAPTGGRS